MKLKILALLAPLGLFVIGYLIFNLYEILGICLGGNTGMSNGKSICYTNPIEIGRMLEIFAPFFLLATLPFLLLQKRNLIAWYKYFVVWGLVLGVILFFIVQADINSYFSFIVNPTWVYTVYGIIFSLISFFFAAITSRKK